MPPRIQVDQRELDAVTRLFRDRMAEGGAFVASEMTTKCPSKYTATPNNTT